MYEEFPIYYKTVAFLIVKIKLPENMLQTNCFRLFKTVTLFPPMGNNKDTFYCIDLLFC